MRRVLVDTNVLSDVFFEDPTWHDWSSRKLSEYGKLIAVNPIIFAELCSKTDSEQETQAILDVLELDYLELPRKALFLAAKAFKSYRENGGIRTSPLSDFFIGAHAEAESFAILTRDARKYATYFPSVNLITPENSLNS